MSRLRFFLLPVALAILVSGLSACSGEPPAGTTAKKIIRVWFHTGRPEEKEALEEQVRRFNADRADMAVALTLIPEGDYNTQVQAAAAASTLPDILDLDGPFLANYAWKGHLLPLDGLLPESLRKDLLPSIIRQGTYNSTLYAVGIFDSGLGLYGNRKKLAAINARIPTRPEDAWSIDEFDRVLADLAATDEDRMVLDLRLDYRGEWYTYAFSPTLVSGGADLIERTTFRSADRVLNSPQARIVLRRVQDWFVRKYIDPNTDTAAFVSGRAALSWCGHWEYPRYRAALGGDLVLLPLPDFGRGSRTGMGSWCWSITRYCKNPGQAMEFILFLLQTREVLAMCEANGAVPATRSAIAASPLYRPEGPLHLFVLQLERTAVPRPRTPAYPVITSAFQQAFQDIRHGGAVQEALDRAVKVIDEDIDDNEGYRPVSRP